MERFCVFYLVRVYFWKARMHISFLVQVLTLLECRRLGPEKSHKKIWQLIPLISRTLPPLFCLQSNPRVNIDLYLYYALPTYSLHHRELHIRTPLAIT